MKLKEERVELSKMLDTSPKEINKNVPESEASIPGLKAEPVTDVNFDELKLKCEVDARIMITNAIAFILPLDMIENNEYLKNKLEVDVISLASMIYQLRTNEVMQKALIDQVNLGMVNAMMFRVFAEMSKTIGELNKQLIQTVEAIKETYKTFREDVKEKRTEALGPSTQGPTGMLTAHDGSVVTRGTKELINNVKRIKRENGIANEFIDEAELIPDIPIKPIEQK
jgi:hypothetical protein